MVTRAGSTERSGIWFGLAGYGIWGLFPIYWPLLKPASALEILAHRVFWTFVLLLIINTVQGSWGAIRSAFADRRTLLLMAAAGILLAVNWGVYIWAVNVNRVVDASLGYFINPLVSVAFAVIFLRERLRPLVWVAIAVGTIAILVMAIDSGAVPWVGLVLAFSFGSYGLLKKLAGLDTRVSLTVETIVITVPAFAYLFWLQLHGHLVFAHHSISQSVFTVLAGPVTAVPLLLFGAALTRVPLSTVGLLQYVTPLGQFLLGLFLFHEAMSTGRWVGFVIVWLALAVFTYDNVAHARRGGVVSLAEID